jgi:hypothetical protein
MITRQQLHDWLTSQEVAASYDTESTTEWGECCPVACCIRDVVDEPGYVFVGNNFIEIGEEKVVTPTWVAEFIGLIDKLFFHDEGIVNVPADEALVILEDIDDSD